jgi:hypothetical protein
VKQIGWARLGLLCCRLGRILLLWLQDGLCGRFAELAIEVHLVPEGKLERLALRQVGLHGEIGVREGERGLEFRHGGVGLKMRGLHDVEIPV